MSAPLLAVSAYMLMQLGIGMWVSRRIRTESDYLLGGRTLGYTLTTFSIFATWFGAETVVGSAGVAYSSGISLRNAEPFGYGLCLLLMGLLFAIPLRTRRITTLADLFRDAFGVTVERAAAIVLIPSSILWAAAQIRAFGHVLAVSSGALEVSTAITIAAAFTILYTVFGGLLVDAITDTIQGVMLIAGITVVFVAVVRLAGGPIDFFSIVTTQQAAHDALRTPQPWLATVEEWAIPVLGSVVATELVGRIAAARSPSVARRSSLAAAPLYLMVGSMPLLVGVVGPHLMPGLADAEAIMPAIAHSILSPVLFALFAGALVSAILSTVDSTLLVSSGLLSHNVIVPALSIQSERARVRIARGGVIVFGVMAFVLALRADGVLTLVEAASAFGGPAAVVLTCFALWSRFGGPRAALACVIGSPAAYLSAVALNLPYPFLASLATAVGAFVAFGLAEPRRKLLHPIGDHA